MGDKLLGRRINAARKDRGITSERLSELCNIDVLEGSGATDLDELTDLLKNATPSQIRMMTAMIRAALGATED